MKFISRLSDEVTSVTCDICGEEGQLIYTLHKEKKTGHISVLTSKTICTNCYVKCSTEYDLSNSQELRGGYL